MKMKMVNMYLKKYLFEKEITDEQRTKLLEIAGKCPVARLVKGETRVENMIQ